MAGFREFVTGEVLTAANVDDFLMKQSVQKYADAAARDAALGTAIAGGNALREGMVAWLDDTDSVIAYDGTAWNPVGAEPPAGIGSNVVTTLKDDTFSTSSTSYVTVTGLTATITPTSNTSKILIVANVAVSNSSTSLQMSRLSIFRGSTDLLDGDGNRGSGFSQTREAAGGADRLLLNQGFHILDSPAVDTATTYEVRIANSEAGVVAYVNRAGGGDTNGTQWIRGTSTITVIEVSA